MNQKRLRVGATQKKILFLLQAGLALGLTHSPRKRAWIWKQIPRELEKINRQALKRAIHSLYSSRLIKEEEDKDGSTTFVLGDQGKERVLKFNIEKIKIKRRKKWDKKWRMVMFDVPEKQKRLREAIRDRFQSMGLLEFQKSVFVSPFPCMDEVEFILEFFNARRYVRFVLAEEIDNELHLKQKFKI